MGGFRKFILRGNVVDLAVGVVIGAAFTAVIQSFVKGIITPLLGIFGGQPDFAAWVIVVGGSKFAIGEFINAIVSFMLVAAVVYWFVVVPTNRLLDRVRGELPVATKTCPECLSKVPAAATRCAFCTIPLSALAAPAP
jgi:large conductance mechanosensitive channel